MQNAGARHRYSDAPKERKVCDVVQGMLHSSPGRQAGARIKPYRQVGASHRVTSLLAPSDDRSLGRIEGSHGRMGWERHMIDGCLDVL